MTYVIVFVMIIAAWSVMMYKLWSGWPTFAKKCATCGKKDRRWLIVYTRCNKYEWQHDCRGAKTND